MPLILYSRPVPHQQVHQPDPVTTTKFHHILPIKNNSTPLHLCPFSPLPTLGRHWPPSLLYKMEGPNPWTCASDFVQQACPTPAGAPARPSHNHQVPPHPTCQSYPSTLNLYPLSHLPSLSHHWPPSLLYKMGGPNPWTCASDFVQQACPTPANTPARPSHNHQVPPHPTCQSYPSTLNLCPLSHLPRLHHQWPPSLLYKMGVPNPWTCASDFVQQACLTPAGTPARPSHNHQVPPHPAYQR